MRLAALLMLSLAAEAADPARAPVVAELFTSEGCSDCPPADRLLENLDRTQPVAGARIIVLSEHVDYWNQLGWRDPFSAPQYSRRQERYARLLGGDVYTPQMVVDGREEVLGNDGSAVLAAIARAARRPKAGVRIGEARRGDAAAMVPLSIPALEKGRGEVWVALADERGRSSVNRGENAGRTLAHVAVVRDLVKVGAVSRTEGMERTVRVSGKLPPPGPARVIVFLADDGGAILGAAAAELR